MQIESRDKRKRSFQVWLCRDAAYLMEKYHANREQNNHTWLKLLFYVLIVYGFCRIQEYFVYLCYSGRESTIQSRQKKIKFMDKNSSLDKREGSVSQMRLAFLSKCGRR